MGPRLEELHESVQESASSVVLNKWTLRVGCEPTLAVTLADTRSTVKTTETYHTCVYSSQPASLYTPSSIFSKVFQHNSICQSLCLPIATLRENAPHGLSLHFIQETDMSLCSKLCICMSACVRMLLLCVICAVCVLFSDSYIMHPLLH